MFGNYFLCHTSITVQLLLYTSSPCRPCCAAPLALTIQSSIWMRASALYCCFPVSLVTLSLLCSGKCLRAGRLWLISASRRSSGQALAFILREPLFPSKLVSTIATHMPWGSCHTDPFPWAWVRDKGHWKMNQSGEKLLQVEEEHTHFAACTNIQKNKLSSLISVCTLAY